MAKLGLRSRLTRLSNLGMLPVLLLLCAVFSVLTYTQQQPTGADAAWRVADVIKARFGSKPRVLIAAEDFQDDRQFVRILRSRLLESGAVIVATLQDKPKDLQRVLESEAASGRKLDALACTQVTASWLQFPNLNKYLPALGQPQIVIPPSYGWPNFLKRDNLLNIANQIAVIAIMAIGMTMVIITAGIDLSVGSLIALSAVVATKFIHDFGGGVNASVTIMLVGSLLGILVCGATGLFSGIMVTTFRLPSFIVTLSVMLMARGLARRLTGGESVYQIPDAYVWLGRGADLLNIPNAVVLMLLLYAAAYVLMHFTVLGRYLYAVGGNIEAARLSGVPVTRVLLSAYVSAGLLAGLGGIVMASLLKSGSPNYGEMYELYVIAAVVVGGTSLMGGEGKVLGTLIGAFIIAVIRNGMNLTGVQSETQDIVLGAVILGAVLLDELKRRGWPWRWGSASLGG